MEFIVKKNTSSNHTIRMPDTLFERLSQIAADKNISFNQIVIQCCEFALEHLQEDEK